MIESKSQVLSCSCRTNDPVLARTKCPCTVGSRLLSCSKCPVPSPWDLSHSVSAWSMPREGRIWTLCPFLPWLLLPALGTAFGRSSKPGCERESWVLRELSVDVMRTCSLMDSASQCSEELLSPDLGAYFSSHTLSCCRPINELALLYHSVWA